MSNIQISTLWNSYNKKSLECESKNEGWVWNDWLIDWSLYDTLPSLLGVEPNQVDKKNTKDLDIANW